MLMTTLMKMATIRVMMPICQVTEAVSTDSGEYECRIMVRQTLSITHTILISESFSVQVTVNLKFSLLSS